MKDNKQSDGISFYGTFTFIYAFLNIGAFFLFLLKTKSEVLWDDQGEVFSVAFACMVLGIAAALIFGIGPAILYKHKCNHFLLYLFPLVLLPISYVLFPFFESMEGLYMAFAFLVLPLSGPIYINFGLGSFNLETRWFCTLAPAITYAFVIFLTTWHLRRRQRRQPAEEPQAL
ncbi:MAG: hypothetical protein J6X35_09220 [Bacteroidales bacterium]|nr:hypothetical protein [Bacteroidales bacterium]MBP5614306.1 hypothetical protein [Bacteroidales bacterium]